MIKKKKILFVVNSYKFFKSHRISIAKKLYKLGYDVNLICKVDIEIPQEEKNFLNIYDFRLLNINKNPLNFITDIFRFKKIVNKINPSHIHFISIVPILLATINRKFLSSFKVIISFSGLGYFAINKNFFTFLFNKIFYFLLKKLFLLDNVKVIYQNKDDLYLINKKIKLDNYPFIIIKGSGVDLEEFNYSSIKRKNTIVFTLISRILRDKGIAEFFEATKLLNNIKTKNNKKIIFNLIGDYDFNNPTSLKEKDVNNWSKLDNNFYLGFKNDIKESIEKSDVIILPSYREGMPKILLEASAVGRAIITTNVPGCRDCVIDNFNGKLIEPRSSESLKKAILFFINNINEINIMGLNSRKIAEKEYSLEGVILKHINIYEN